MNTGTNVLNIYINGALSKPCSCLSTDRTTRKFCYAGRDQALQRYANGRMASLGVRDWALWTHEIAQVYAAEKLPLAAPFELNADFPPRMQSGVKALFSLTPPFTAEAGVTVTIAVNVTGAILSTSTLSWTTAQLSTVRWVQVTMPTPAVPLLISFSFTAVHPRFLPPAPIEIGVFTQSQLFDECIHTVTIRSKPSNAGFLPSPYVAGVGTALLAPLPPLAAAVENKMFVNLNNFTDTGSNTTVDTFLVTKGKGFTVTLWVKIDTATGPTQNHWLWTMWKTGFPELGWFLRTDGDCFVWGTPDWYSYSQPLKSPSTKQTQFGCGKWTPNVSRTATHTAREGRGSRHNTVQELIASLPSVVVLCSVFVTSDLASLIPLLQRVQFHHDVLFELTKHRFSQEWRIAVGGIRQPSHRRSALRVGGAARRIAALQIGGVLGGACHHRGEGAVCRLCGARMARLRQQHARSIRRSPFLGSCIDELGNQSRVYSSSPERVSCGLRQYESLLPCSCVGSQ
jgi:hypothetical protein